MRVVQAGGQAWRTQHDPRPNFGLGDATVAEVVRIEWPSGIVQELTDVAGNQILTVVEPVQLRWIEDNGISWSVRAEGYRLESAAHVDGPWSEASEEVVIHESRKIVAIDTRYGTRFYRLVKP